MATTRFDTAVNGEWFTCVKITDEGDKFFLYVLPHNKNTTGFFMLQDEDNNWHIPNKILVDRTTLEIEPILAEQIKTDLEK